MKTARLGRSRAKAKPADGRVRRAKRKSVPLASTPADESGAISGALFGIDHGGHAREVAEPNVEDPLVDLVEESAEDGDRWLRERGGESVQQPPE